jgi:hypothetical protein
LLGRDGGRKTPFLDRRLTWAQTLLKETEKLLEKWKHPDPYIHPTAPGGAHSHDYGAFASASAGLISFAQDPNTRETSRLLIWTVSYIPLWQAARLLADTFFTAPPPLKF